MNLGLKKF